MRNRALVSFAAVIALAASCRPPESAHPAPGAKRMLLIVVDQLRADLIDRAPMPALQKLRDRGAFFEDAYVGHLAAKTVVSHGVMPRGVFPKRLGWNDDSFRDSTGALGTAGAMVISELPVGDLQKLLPPDLPPSVVASYLGHPKHVFIGEKDYAVAAMAGNEADIDITLGKAPEKPGWLKPAGVHVPPYISGEPGSRFWLDATKTYGTEASSYALGGNKFVRGDDPAHEGGDVWVADAALAVMDHEDWGALFVTFGGVDKVGHMMGSDHDLDHPNPTSIRFATQLATVDQQIGRLLDALEKKGLASETAIVVTADHGGMWAEHLHARNRPGHADDDWQWGRFSRGQSWLDPQPEIAELVAGGGIDVSRNDTAIRVWATKNDPRASTIPDRLKKLPGVIGVYRRNGARYETVWEDFSRTSARESAWAAAHAHELLDTMASPSAADFVALLDDKTGYGVPGDHGGAQESNQRIPLIFAGANVKPGRYPGRARLVDVAPTLWALAGNVPPAGLDGVALCAGVRASPACSR